MHPQIRMDHKDICPLCGMDLTPVKASSGGGDGPADPIELSSYAQMMARVTTVDIRRRELFKDIRTVGRVELDETRVAYLASRVDGRVDVVFADFPGTPVRKGEHLVSIYSPQLYSTQEEFLIAIRAEKERPIQGGPNLGPSLIGNARKRLELWGLTAEQLDELAQRGKAETHLVVYAPIGGTVIEKSVRAGQYVKEGDALYTIADLSRVWLVLEVYESELSWVRLGQLVQVTLESEPTKPVTGQVAFIEPLLNQASRTVRVRVILDNPDGKFKPGMYSQASLHIPLLPDGTPAPGGLEGKYACPMHPYEVADQPRDCKLCGMPLEKVPAGDRPSSPSDNSAVIAATPTDKAGVNSTSDPAGKPQPILAVPAEAVLTTGLHQLVYVERKPGQYQLVEPKLGPRAGDFYPVLAGLAEGDRVVAQGNFLLDSQFQVTGKYSLLNPPSVAASAKELANIEQLPGEERRLALAQEVCPITGEKLGSMGKPYKVHVGERVVFLCCKGCEGAVKKDPMGTLKKLNASASQQPGAEKPAESNPSGADESPPRGATSQEFTAEELEALNELPPAERELALAQKICPITGERLGSMGKPYKMNVGQRVIFLCCEGCEDSVLSDPESAIKKLDESAGAKTASRNGGM